jgi:hypothetical protein
VLEPSCAGRGRCGTLPIVCARNFPFAWAQEFRCQVDGRQEAEASSARWRGFRTHFASAISQVPVPASSCQRRRRSCLVHSVVGWLGRRSDLMPCLDTEAPSIKRQSCSRYSGARHADPEPSSKSICRATRIDVVPPVGVSVRSGAQPQIDPTQAMTYGALKVAQYPNTSAKVYCS